MIKNLPIRYEFALLASLAWFLSFADRVNMSVAAIAMQDQFDWTETTKGVVMAVVYIGYIPAHIIGGWLSDRIGGTRVLAGALLGWSLMTLLTPAAADISLAWLIATRIALGFCEGFAVPASFTLLGRWSTDNERSRMLAIITMGATLGAPGGLMISGWLTGNFGWQWAFYPFGLAGMALLALWLRRMHDDPDTHPRITAAERDYLAKSRVIKKVSVAIPWKMILSHRAVWALAISKFCVFWTLFTFIAWMPSYFSSVQGVSVAGSGLFSALPWVAMSLMLYLSSWIADGMMMRGHDRTFVRKLMQSIGLGGSLIFMLLIIQADTLFLAILITCSALGFLAFCWSGTEASIVEISPRYSGSISGFVGTIGNLPGIIGIGVTGWLVDTTGSYESGFVLTAIISLIGITAWLLFGTAKKIID